MGQIYNEIEGQTLRIVVQILIILADLLSLLSNLIAVDKYNYFQCTSDFLERNVITLSKYLRVSTSEILSKSDNFSTSDSFMAHLNNFI